MLTPKKLMILRAAMIYFCEEVAVHGDHAVKPYFPSTLISEDLPTSLEVLALSQEVQNLAVVQAVLEPASREISILPNSSQSIDRVAGKIFCSILVNRIDLSLLP